MNKWKTWRRASQAFFVALLAYLGLRHQFVGGGPSGAAPIDSYCVFGGIETLFSWLTTGSFLSKTAMSNIILLGALLISLFLVGGAFCGWVCPLGAIQEWVGKLSFKIVGRRLRIPFKVDRWLQYTKYLILLIIIFFTIKENTLWFQDYDPFKVLFHFNFETASAYWVLITFLILSAIVKRFWCRYLCPLGAIINPISRLSLFKVKRDQSHCSNCHACTAACSLHKPEPGIQGILTNGCNVCLDCIDRCKSKQALGLKLGTRWAGSSARLAIPIVVLSIFSLFVVLSMAAGLWNTTMVLSEVQYEPGGQVVTEDLKGWMTLKDIAERYKTPPGQILEGLSWDDSTDPDTPLKDLAKQHGTDMESLKSTLSKLLK